MKKWKHLFIIFTVRHSWYRVARLVFFETCNSFIYHLAILPSKVNAYIIGFLVPLNKEKILRIIFPLSRCVALREIPLILTSLYLVDVYMYFLWHKISKSFEVCPMTFFVIFFFLENKYLEKEVSERGIDIICNKLGKKSYQLAIELGLLPEEIEQTQMDFRLSIERSREYIKKWRQREKNNATYKFLLQALATVEVDSYREILLSIY